MNADFLEMREKGLHSGCIHTAMHQLVADQAVAVWCRRINRQKESHAILIDLINAQDTRELSNDPLLVIGLKIESCLVRAAPSPDHALAGTDPEITSQPAGYPPEGQAVFMDGVDGLSDDTLTVGGPHMQEGRLGTEVVSAVWTVMDANCD
jgi:hypothetical protein